MALPRLLLIDDNATRALQFEGILSYMEYQVSVVNTAGCLSTINEIDGLSAIFIGNGCEKLATLIKSVLDCKLEVPIILLIDKGSSLQVPSAIQGMVTKIQEWPSVYSVLMPILNELPTPKKLTKKGRGIKDNKGLAGCSGSIKEVRVLIDQVAIADATVLVLGESGTGKEVVAQALHRASNRKSKPFVPVNCGAIPGELLESELFGHEKGAFTGALTARQGRFEMAEGGTLFLDEIGDMPMPMQVKLLRVLQERTFERVGSNKTIVCDVRIIAATHRNLENEIIEKRFREDLFYRLNVFPIELPSLKERVEDIPLLVQDLVQRMEKAKKVSVQFTTSALALMMQHPWTGNIRELSNFIERLSITNPNGLIDEAKLPEKFQNYEVPVGFVVNEIVEEKIEEPAAMFEAKVESQIAVPEARNDHGVVGNETGVVSQLPEKGMDLKEYLSDMEINLIKQALSECNGVVAHAAKLLNMRRTTLVEKLRKYELS